MVTLDHLNVILETVATARCRGGQASIRIPLNREGAVRASGHTTVLDLSHSILRPPALDHLSPPALFALPWRLLPDRSPGSSPDC